MKLIIDNYEFELREMDSYSDRYVIYVLADNEYEVEAYSKIAYNLPSIRNPTMLEFKGIGIRILGKYYAPQLILK